MLNRYNTLHAKPPNRLRLDDTVQDNAITQPCLDPSLYGRERARSGKKAPGGERRGRWVGGTQPKQSRHKYSKNFQEQPAF